MTLVIGIAGFKGSGKGTVGDYLVNHYQFENESFATPLKDSIASIFEWNRELLEGISKESREWRETPDEWWEKELDWDNHPGRKYSDRFTPRVALQYFGTDILRVNFHNDIWILSLKNRLRNKNRVVITDCRFPNEFELIKKLNGYTIRVKRGEEPSWYDLALNANNQSNNFSSLAQKELKSLGIHPSETSWVGFPFDFIIENDSTLLALEEKIKCSIESILSN